MRAVEGFPLHGEKAIAKVRRTQPGVYLKVLALLIPREHRVERSNSLKDWTDEELDAGIDLVKQMLESRAAASGAVIEGQAVEVLAAKPLRGSARLLQHVDSSVGTAASDRQRERRRSMKEKKKGESDEG